METIKVDAEKYNKIKHDLLRARRILDYIADEVLDSIVIDDEPVDIRTNDDSRLNTS